MPESPTSTRNFRQCLWATARPRQWIKSSFILAPALFTLDILQAEIWPSLLIGVLGFSLVASAIYTFNDIFNRHEDAGHPLKKQRPIASGDLSIPVAGVITVVFLLAGLVLLELSLPGASRYGWMYAALMIAYTLVLRRLFLVDVIVIAVGFVIRINVGAFMVQEPVSDWLVLCTFTIALFLGMIKRRQELAAIDTEATDLTRSVLADYPSVRLVDGWVQVLAGITVLCYALYTVDPATIAKHHTSKLYYTVPFVLYGIFRYQMIAVSGRKGEDPASLIIRDPGLKIVVVLWVLAVGAILYLSRNGI